VDRNGDVVAAVVARDCMVAQAVSVRRSVGWSRGSHAKVHDEPRWVDLDVAHYARSSFARVD
jgi:hypothetical protein